MLKSILYKSLKDTKLKITPTCFGSQRIHHQGVISYTFTEITCSGSQIFIMCAVGVWQHNSEPVVCVCVMTGHKTSFQPVVRHTHTTGSELCHQTPTTHMINICEPQQVLSVKVQVITPWWWILCDPKHVGVNQTIRCMRISSDTTMY